MRETCPKCKGSATVESLRSSLDGGQTFAEQRIYRCLKTKDPCKATKVTQPETRSEK